MRYYAIPLDIAEANALVALWHRHHGKALQHRFSIGAIDGDGKLHGAAICGIPKARLAGHPRDVLEVQRLVTDGTENCCSVLYAAAARAAAAMGFLRIQTYVLAEEPGTSLRAAGWVNEGEAGGGRWNRSARNDHPTTTKHRWVKHLRARPTLAEIPRRIETLEQDALFGEGSCVAVGEGQA